MSNCLLVYFDYWEKSGIMATKCIQNFFVITESVSGESISIIVMLACMQSPLKRSYHDAGVGLILGK